MHITHHMDKEFEIDNNGRIVESLVATITHIIPDTRDVGYGISAIAILKTILCIVLHRVPKASFGILLRPRHLVLPTCIVGKGVAKVMVALCLRFLSKMLVGNMTNSIMRKTAPRQSTIANKE